ncbi:IS3 family transposase [Paenibacillus polymyxa]|uniref:IS3 family transposase n=1 Tax=Paenibacillus polymyxa TaxID=1406 RepID=UPI0037C71499
MDISPNHGALGDSGCRSCEKVNEEIAQSKIEKYIRFYYRKRPQRKLKKLTPVEYRRQFPA